MKKVHLLLIESSFKAMQKLRKVAIEAPKKRNL